MFLLDFNFNFISGPVKAVRLSNHGPIKTSIMDKRSRSIDVDNFASTASTITCIAEGGRPYPTFRSYYVQTLMCTIAENVILCKVYMWHVTLRDFYAM